MGTDVKRSPLGHSRGTKLLVTYRIPSEEFPIEFEWLGQQWRLVVEPVRQGNFWWAQFQGPGCWHITHAATEARVFAALRETGVEINQRSFVGTLFLRLEQLRAAERYPCAISGV